MLNFIGNALKLQVSFIKTYLYFRLPQDMYQTAKVAKILLLLEQGKGEKFKGKNLNEIEIENEIYYSSESDNDEEPLINKVLRKAAHTETCNITPVSEGCSSTMQATSDDIPKESTSKRIEDNSREVKGIGFV